MASDNVIVLIYEDLAALRIVEVVGKILKQQRIVQSGVFEGYEFHPTARTTLAPVSFAKSFVTAWTVNSGTLLCVEEMELCVEEMDAY